MAEFPWAADARVKRNDAVYGSWAGMNNQQKSQIKADVLWGAEDQPRWSLSCPGDPQQPPLVIKAPDEHSAKGRYQEICGVRSWGENQPAAVPYQEPSPG